MISGVSAGPDVDVYTRRVKNCIEHCIKGYMDVEQTTERLWRAYKVPRHITYAMWRTLEEINPEFFREYSLRLVLMRQIERFNALLNRQAQIQFMSPPPPPPCLDNYCLLAPPPSSLFDQNCPSNDDGQLMKFSNMVPSAAIALPHGSSSVHPNGCANMGNNMDALHYMTLAPNSNLPYGFSDGSFMHLNYPSCGFSSTFSGNGNMPQLPIMHDNSLSYFSGNQQVDGCYMSPLNAHTSNNTEIHSPMNTEDENGTVTQLAFGGLTMDGSPSSA